MRYSIRWFLPLVLGMIGFGFAPPKAVFARRPLPPPSLTFTAPLKQADATAQWQALAEQLYTAFASQDAQAYFQLWSTQAPERADQQKILRRYWTEQEKIELLQVQVLSVQREPARAVLRVKLELRLTSRGVVQQVPQARRLECVQEAAGWRVWRDFSAEQELVETLAGIAVEAERAAQLAKQPALINAQLAQALLAQGRRASGQIEYAGAARWFRLALQVAEQCHDQISRGQALNNLGVVYSNQGDFENALLSLQQSLTLKDAKDLAGRAVTLNNIGNLFMEQAEYERAIEYHRQALALRELEKEADGQASVLGNLGNDYYRQGNYRLALDYYQQALPLRDAADRLWHGGILNNIGNIYRYQGDFELALDYYQRGLAIAKEELPQAARIKNNIGTVYILRRQFAQAEALLQESLAQRSPEDLDGRASVLNNLGAVAQERGELARAQTYFQQSLQLREAFNQPLLIAESLINLAHIAHLRDCDNEALALIERALHTARHSDQPDLRWQACVQAGQIYRALNRPDQARSVFEEAVQAIETMRANVAGDASEQERFFENKVEPYYALVELALARQQPAVALGYAERAKARVLLDVMQRGHVNINKTLGADEQATEQRLQARLVSLNTQLYRERLRLRPEAARLAELEVALQAARTAQQQFQNALSATHPALKIARGQTPPFDLAAVAGTLLNPQTALLEYVVNEDKTWLFVLTAGATKQPQLKVYDLPISRQQLNQDVEAYWRLLSGRALNFRPAATRLYQLLLQPAAAQIQGKSHLIIVRDANLWELPFQALQTLGGQYLIESCAVSYAHSLTALAEMVKSRRQGQPGQVHPMLLAFGNPSLGETAGTNAARQRSAGQLAPLPSAETEVTQLAKLYAANRRKVYLGAAAREERFKAEAGQADILHLATHALLNNASPLYSQIVLAQTPASADSLHPLAAGAEPFAAEAPREDGLLEAWEVMKLNLHAELVVLSACETGRGRLGAGEGLIGLTWAFFVAGAPSTIVSQWPVDAASTALLMQSFHRQWRAPEKTPLGKAAALRAAALKLLATREYRHPFFWASFSLLGEPL
jgi:CHAT domain-containing protein